MVSRCQQGAALTLGVGLGVDLLVVVGALPAGARLRPDVGVDPAQQALAMDVVAQTLDPVREFLGVGLRDAAGVAVAGEGDALLDDHGLVALAPGSGSVRSSSRGAIS